MVEIVIVIVNRYLIIEKHYNIECFFKFDTIYNQYINLFIIIKLLKFISED